MELNVGDYVRTKKRRFQKPQIAKIINISKDEGYKNQNYITLDHNLIPDYEFNIYEADVAKSSPNIIDLLKKKDILIDYKGNIYQVVKVWNNYVFTDKKNKYGQVITLVDYQIKSVLTHEQFEAMKYVVGD